MQFLIFVYCLSLELKLNLNFKILRRGSGSVNVAKRIIIVLPTVVGDNINIMKTTFELNFVF